MDEHANHLFAQATDDCTRNAFTSNTTVLTSGPHVLVSSRDDSVAHDDSAGRGSAIFPLPVETSREYYCMPPSAVQLDLDELVQSTRSSRRRARALTQTMPSPGAHATDKALESSSSSSSSSETDQAEAHVESLISGREKRTTAGNRLSGLLEREVDDELELLFAEDEEDVEFDEEEAAEQQSDVQLESSDGEDDDDQAGEGRAGHEDLEGERELQRQNRNDRQARKRKPTEAFFKTPRLLKKLKIDPTTSDFVAASSASRAKKKSERVSWMPEMEGGPVRSSTRGATVQNKEIIYARMKEDEERRLKMVAALGEKREKVKVKAMTQEERLAEAARVEELNSKSLNRWEETEKKRSEEQAARLLAMQNRHLNGPVISWWSGLSEWVNGRLSRVGRQDRAPLNSKKPTAGQAPASPLAPLRADAIFLPPSTSADVAVGGVTVNRPDSQLAGNHLHEPLAVERLSTTSAAPEPGPKPLATASQPTSASVAPVDGAVVERSTRNYLILENFDPTAIKSHDTQRRILFKQKRERPPSEC